jgi:acetyltransferase
MVETNDITREIFVGFKRDESFGNILFLWAWWIYVNIYNDIARRIGLVSKDEILKMLEELTIFPILQWARWKASIHFESLVDTIFRLQYLFDTCKQIKEIDINPIFVDDEKSIIIDAKFYLYNS